ncbi:ABC transporter substrate-binding protein [Chelatococcus reniformis]|uniref:Branched-chain amino acid ABC transporter substrate-binding protein n=1 Tax=Chelatococcus reniformis TaxID=1494448 RepID=A0A916XB61_9HYPH|nr:ABC transporter substrate-binding protein [Chelatococcus reniformis]GGC58807.1 branched-chain amino acid ABC transporter substrate-binding protein [Chelatococcus reniformis]
MPVKLDRRGLLLGAGTAALYGLGQRTAMAKSYGPGVTDTEIKLGTTSPYSGPASGFGVYGLAQSAYFEMVNAGGGINGRKINLISLDNAYNPPKALEQTRRLVESDNVFAIAGFLGTAPNTSVQKYLNAKAVPSLFLTSGAERFNDPANFPWIVPFYPTYVDQSEIYAKYILQSRPNAKIAVQFINDDLGRDFVRGLKKGLGAAASTMIIKEISHELTEPTIEHQIVELRATGADVFCQFTTAKFAAQGIRKAGEIGWKPMYVLASVASSIGATLVPAGLDNSKGVITCRWEKIPTDPITAADRDVKDYRAFLDRYMPRHNVEDNTTVPGYINAHMITQVLRRCGDDLTRENLLKQATHLQRETPPMVIDGIPVYNSPTDYLAYHALQLARFNGTGWSPLGPPIAIGSGKS